MHNITYPPIANNIVTAVTIWLTNYDHKSARDYYPSFNGSISHGD